MNQTTRRTSFHLQTHVSKVGKQDEDLFVHQMFSIVITGLHIFTILDTTLNFTRPWVIWCRKILGSTFNCLRSLVPRDYSRSNQKHFKHYLELCMVHSYFSVTYMCSRKGTYKLCSRSVWRPRLINWHNTLHFFNRYQTLVPLCMRLHK